MEILVALFFLGLVFYIVYTKLYEIESHFIKDKSPSKRAFESMIVPGVFCTIALILYTVFRFGHDFFSAGSLLCLLGSSFLFGLLGIMILWGMSMNL